MYKALLLRFHRWTTLIFSLPLAAIILTGLVLSFEPMVQELSIKPGTLDAARVISLIQRQDPDGKARGLFIDSGAGTLTLQGSKSIDLATGEPSTASSATAGVFQWARRTHERLLGYGWLVSASTFAMLLLMVFGILMGLPRLRNSLSGWHKGVAWFALPLIVLSPLTGLFLAYNITFQGTTPRAGAAAGGKPPTLVEAVQIVAKSHDISRMTSLGQRGGRLMARINEDGSARAFQVTADGATELPRNWPRLIHEGNWSNLLGSLLNVITSLALITLLSTGMTIWAKRSLRPRRRRAAATQAQTA